ncbi:hypothetical protein A3842_11045 [Paenibacillus sp. P3E]|uniref:hypothetical protein n=1 Tax=Paenibacillus sp. P3E TaxID=1349435 RepID=UPI00093CEB63|nr:hypothetical protein [Paenibacillus sp. P3E]OKP81609.1 hypothetical protein A3842_11045 [Paenibacillus sp. P3E]
MSEKVVLTKEQAGKISKLLEFHPKERIISDFVTTENRSKEGLTLDVLIQALYIGYEVTQTVEERLIDFHGSFTKTVTARDYITGQMAGEVIAEVLNIIGMKVKGIND